MTFIFPAVDSVQFLAWLVCLHEGNYYRKLRWEAKTGLEEVALILTVSAGKNPNANISADKRACQVLFVMLPTVSTKQEVITLLNEEIHLCKGSQSSHAF